MGHVGEYGAQFGAVRALIRDGVTCASFLFPPFSLTHTSSLLYACPCNFVQQVKLCSVGYGEFDILAQKFYVLYNTCKEQLSAQKHYDWGLRNILAVS